MKIIKSDSGSCLLKMTQIEWAEIGAKENWLEPQHKKTNRIDAAPGQESSPPDNLLAIDQMKATRVEKYGDKFWAVYVDGETGEQLVCVTLYRKGALEVKRILDTMIARLGAWKSTAKLMDDKMVNLRAQQGQLAAEGT